MAQIFHRSTNTIARVSIYGAVFILGVAGYVAWEVNQSSYFTNAKLSLEQPVPFSHKHHAAELGIDCRYCHTSVETSSFAGLPPTSTCMTCHSQIWVNSSMLEPVRASYRTDQSLAWTRVNALPDFVYFNHSIHVAKGIGCVSCHGAIDQMALTWRTAPLTMEWCLGCHRDPAKQLRPSDQVFNLHWRAQNQSALGIQLIRSYGIDVRRLTDCSVCHR